jgi:hypothetical protein
MLTITSIPFFTDQLSAVKFINKLKLCLKERAMWEDGRTRAQVAAGTTYLISEALLNNWLSARLIGTDSRMTSLRDEIDAGLSSFQDNADKVIKMFEKFEKDRRREEVMKAKHGGDTQPSWSMSFGAQVRLNSSEGITDKKRTRDENDPVCYVCKQIGHKAPDCPTRNEARGIICKACGRRGHVARECPNGGQQFWLKCFLCGKVGHIKKKCPLYKSENGRDSTQFRQVSKATGVSSRGDFVNVRGADGQRKGKILKSEVGSHRSFMAEVGILSNMSDDDDKEQEDDIVLNADEDEYHDQVIALVAKQGEVASSGDEGEW